MYLGPKPVESWSGSQTLPEKCNREDNHSELKTNDNVEINEEKTKDDSQNLKLVIHLKTDATNIPDEYDTSIMDTSEIQDMDVHEIPVDGVSQSDKSEDVTKDEE